MEPDELQRINREKPKVVDSLYNVIARTEGLGATPRYVWKLSPDSEEIRQRLLKLLETVFEYMSRDRYPIGAGLGEMNFRLLGEFREKRAVRYLEWIHENLKDSLDFMEDAASEALAKIRGDE